MCKQRIPDFPFCCRIVQTRAAPQSIATWQPPARSRRCPSFRSGAATARRQIYYLIKSYCEGGVGCYYSASNRAGTARIWTVRADHREDLGQVLCANDDTWRRARGSPGSRQAIRCPGSSAYLGLSDHLSAEGLRCRPRLWSHSERPLLGFDKNHNCAHRRPCKCRRKDG